MAFDPSAATAAYIDSLGAAELARAAAYTAETTGSCCGDSWSLARSPGSSCAGHPGSRVGAAREARGEPARLRGRGGVLPGVGADHAAMVHLRGVVARARLRSHQPAARGLPGSGRDRHPDRHADRRAVRDGRVCAHPPHRPALVALVGRARGGGDVAAAAAGAGAHRTHLQRLQARAGGRSARRARRHGAAVGRTDRPHLRLRRLAPVEQLHRQRLGTRRFGAHRDLGRRLQGCLARRGAGRHRPRRSVTTCWVTCGVACS